jgi:hypothetical protein
MTCETLYSERRHLPAYTVTFVYVHASGDLLRTQRLRNNILQTRAFPLKLKIMRTQQEQRLELASRCPRVSQVLIQRLVQACSENAYC